MPDTIQFHNGNQIVHRYDASGRRLSTRYATIYFQLAQPLNQGEVVYGIDVCYEDNVSIVGNDYVGNIEYYTARYFDYDLSEVPVESHLANKVYFDQGYIQGFRLVHSTPRYYYFRHDQLGNIREVWAAAYIRYGQTKPAATVQRIQYYPSGLPWKNNDTYSPIGQNRKYNGKEFVEMHGLDEYDSQAKWYYPAIMRTSTMDPLAEKYYDISPYAWCGNNPVKFVDPDGRKIIIKGTKEYCNKVKGDLKQLSKDHPEIQGNIQKLIKSPHKHKIKMPNDKNGFNDITYDDQKTQSKQGSTIDYNPDNELTKSGEKRTPRVGLAHELQHAIDLDEGKLDTKTKTETGVPIAEIDAINTENKVRVKTGDIKRTTYAGKKISRIWLDN